MPFCEPLIFRRSVGVERHEWLASFQFSSLLHFMVPLIRAAHCSQKGIRQKRRLTSLFVQYSLFQTSRHPFPVIIHSTTQHNKMQDNTQNTSVVPSGFVTDMSKRLTPNPLRWVHAYDPRDLPSKGSVYPDVSHRRPAEQDIWSRQHAVDPWRRRNARYDPTASDVPVTVANERRKAATENLTIAQNTVPDHLVAELDERDENEADKRLLKTVAGIQIACQLILTDYNDKHPLMKNWSESELYVWDLPEIA